MRIFTFLLIILSIIQAAPLRADDPVSNAELLKSFDLIAFGNEYTGKRYDIVRKWAKPVLMGIEG